MNTNDNTSDNTSDPDTRHFADAVHRDVVTSPDLLAISTTARRDGTRLRRRRQAGVGLAAAAVVAIAAVTVTVTGGSSDTGPARDVPAANAPDSAAPTSNPPTEAPTSTTPDKDDPVSNAYAVLEAPPWVLTIDNLASGEPLGYINLDTPLDDNLTLDWRPDGDARERLVAGKQVATTTMAGDPAVVYRDDYGLLTVVGPVIEGHFLSLTAGGPNAQELAELATRVHRLHSPTEPPADNGS